MSLVKEFNKLIETINSFYKIVTKSGERWELDDTLFLEKLLNEFKKKLEEKEKEDE